MSLISFLAASYGQVAGVNVSPQNPLPVATQHRQYEGVPTSFEMRTAEGDVETLYAGQKCRIQNLATDPLFVRRGTGASTTACHYVLAAGTADDDGKGGVIEIDDFIGVVSVAGTTPRYLAWKV